MKKYILLIVLLPFLLLACNNDGTSSTESKSKDTDKKFHVTYVSQFGTAPVDTNEYSAGDTITLPNMQNGCENNKAYIFIRWLKNGEHYFPGTSYVINGDTTFTATFRTENCMYGCDSECAACAPAPSKYRVTYEADLGNAPIDPKFYEAGDSVTIQNMNFYGCNSNGDSLIRFNGWQLNGVDYVPGSAYTIYGDTTFTATYFEEHCARDQVCVAGPDGCSCVAPPQF